MSNMNQDQNQNQTKPIQDQSIDLQVHQNQQNQQDQKVQQQQKPARAKIQTRVQPGVQTGVQAAVQTGVQTGVQTDQNLEKAEEAQTFCSFIYNPRTGAVLGRTRSSWGRILLFYLVFYSLLSAMFCFTLWMVLLTLDPDSPKYSHLLQNPGLVIQPQVLEISFNRSEPSEYHTFYKALTRTTTPCSRTANTTTVFRRPTTCAWPESSPSRTGTELWTELWTRALDPGLEPVQRKVCQFRRSLLRSCSGLTDPQFGFKDGRPCVLIRMNRVVGLKPSGDPFINCSSKVCELFSS
ncbi:hypothetical protein WMY93_031846 [Mugilogobius chulae]|uniref:Sodium/potassium-transporting ATPase subunit beta-3 n=1 Tax=Mugilogobius chulae TaxID=88201 RepID=A0AAW0MFJ6_9GOBI